MRKTTLKRWAIPFFLCGALAMGCSLFSYSFSTTAYDMNFGSAYSGGTELEIISGRDVRFELNARIDEGKLSAKIYNPSGTLIKEYLIASTGLTQETFSYEKGKWTIRIASEGGKGYFKVRLHDRREYEGFQE
jgi:hypothetical protein